MHQFFNCIQSVADFKLVFLIDSGVDFRTQLSKTGRALLFVNLVESLFVFRAETFFNPAVEFIKFRRKYRRFPRLFACFDFEFVNHINNALEIIKTEHDGVQHRFFRKFVSFGFNHQNAFFCSGYG